MSRHAPTRMSRWLVELCVRWLDLPDRVRYREELTSELNDLARGRQFRYALSAVRGAYALRRALNRPAEETDLEVSLPWRCRMQWHRFVARPDPNEKPDGTAKPVYYLECARCGRLSTVVVRRRNYVLGSIMVGVLLWAFAPTMVFIVLSLGLGAGVVASYAGDLMQMSIHGPGYQYRDPPPGR